MGIAEKKTERLEWWEILAIRLDKIWLLVVTLCGRSQFMYSFLQRTPSKQLHLRLNKSVLAGLLVLHATYLLKTYEACSDDGNRPVHSSCQTNRLRGHRPLILAAQMCCQCWHQVDMHQSTSVLAGFDCRQLDFIQATEIHQKKGPVTTCLSRSLKIIRIDTDHLETNDFLLVAHSNHGPICYRFWDIQRLQSKITNVSHCHVFNTLL